MLIRPTLALQVKKLRIYPCCSLPTRIATTFINKPFVYTREPSFGCRLKCVPEHFVRVPHYCWGSWRSADYAASRRRQWHLALRWGHHDPWWGWPKSPAVAEYRPVSGNARTVRAATSLLNNTFPLDPFYTLSDFIYGQSTLVQLSVKWMWFYYERPKKTREVMFCTGQTEVSWGKTAL